MIIRLSAVMPKVVVSGRDKDLPDDHLLTLPDAEPDFPDNFGSEALLQFSQDFRL
jgi:hypothetical protein